MPHQRFIEVFEIGTNDGDSRKKGTREGQYHWRGAYLDYDVVFSVSNNLEPFLDLELPDRPIAEILFKAPRGNWEIAEFEIFGMVLLRRPAMYPMSLIWAWILV